MEFPHLGRNCAFRTCNRLDFLPFKCGACLEWFCSDHFAYANHECPAPNTEDVRVPECPLCGVPVPGRHGDCPDVAVGKHIDNQCQSDPAKKRRQKVFTNRCSYKGCKTKEMMPIVCYECELNFCLKHRHCADHACERTFAGEVKSSSWLQSWFYRPSRRYSSGNGQGSSLNLNYFDILKVVGGIILALYVLATLKYMFNSSASAVSMFMISMASAVTILMIAMMCWNRLVIKQRYIRTANDSTSL